MQVNGELLEGIVKEVGKKKHEDANRGWFKFEDKTVGYFASPMKLTVRKEVKMSASVTNCLTKLLVGKLDRRKRTLRIRGSESYATPRTTWRS